MPLGHGHVKYVCDLQRWISHVSDYKLNSVQVFVVMDGDDGCVWHTCMLT